MTHIGSRIISTTASLLVVVSSLASAQTSAPAPSQIGAAHTVFLAPAGVRVPNNEDVTGTIYNATYRMLSSLGPYKMVTDSSSADISIEVSAEPDYAYLRLTLYDTKTHTLLWVVDSPLQGVFNANTLDAAEARAADDLHDLISGVVPISPAAKKKAQKH